MRRVTLLLLVLHIGSLPGALCAQEKTPQGSGGGERVGVLLGADRQTLAPGESFKVWASRKVLSGESLRFPTGYYFAALARLHVKTPDGRLFVYWPHSSPRESVRPLWPKEFRASLRAGQSQVVLTTTVFMLDPSPRWLDAATAKPAQPSFRAVGKYEIWVEYRVPKVDGAPADAWHGHARSRTIHVLVREIPVAERRREPQAAQLADIKALMAGKGDRLKLWNRLRDALRRTENEGLAGHMAALLRKHQPADALQPYPPWWYVMYGSLCARAYHGTGSLAIKGPYLPDLIAASMTALEHRMAGPPLNAKGRWRHPDVSVGLLLAYLRETPEGVAAIRDRLEKLGRRYAKIPPRGPDVAAHRLAHYRLGASWRILFSLGILRDGMPAAKAAEVLGGSEPGVGIAVWSYSSPMHVNPRLRGRVVQGADGKTIHFTSKRHLK